MTATNRIRIATTDSQDAVGVACSEVESAVGLPVQVEFQEIEGECLILELRLGDDNVPSPSPSRLAVAVDKAVPDVEVLSAWTEPTSIWRPPRRSDAIVTVLNDSCLLYTSRCV